MKRSRRTISFSAAFFARLSTAAIARGLTPTRLVELAVADLSTVNVARVKTRSSPADFAHHALGQQLRSTVPIEVDEGTASILADLVVRSRDAGGEITEGELLDDAIVRFLDAMRWPRADSTRATRRGR